MEEDELPEDDRKRKETPAISGSLSHIYGSDNELLRSQFQLHTALEERQQIVLLQVHYVFQYHNLSQKSWEQ